MFDVPEDRAEIHSKLDALLDAGFPTLAAIISQLHYEAFFRKNLPEGSVEARTQARLDAEAPRLLDPAVTTDVEFEEAVLGDEAHFEVLEAPVRTVVRGESPELADAERLLCNQLRKELKEALGQQI